MEVATLTSFSNLYIKIIIIVTFNTSYSLAAFLAAAFCRTLYIKLNLREEENNPQRNHSNSVLVILQTNKDEYK